MSELDLERLIAENTAPLLRGAVSFGFSQADAEELVQDTFAAFLEGKARFEGRSSPRTYLFGILYNKGAELSRRRKKESGVEDVEAVFEARFDRAGHWLAGSPKGPEKEALDAELAEIIKRCVEGLTDQQRTAFLLKETEGMPPDDVCNVLGVSDTNLRVLLFRARLKLRECLERSWEAR